MKVKMKCFVTGLIMTSVLFFATDMEGKEHLQKQSNSITVQLEKVYLDGDVSIERHRASLEDKDTFWSQYKGWTLVEQKEDFALFRKQIDDISPLSKANGYIGLSEDGVISTFHGRPDGWAEPIHLFFQIDTSRLESHVEEQLEQGIPFRTKDEFEHVLEVMKTYRNEISF
ncbi:forespore regulator of the sigma-K checkpoint [Bacillus pumilus]|nr:forespore regulator of the sigma-K checkpoint [Bacillus pumilus]MDF9784676.1 forespore regulator of the sigma-K checkpoint [Bacillus pumilus]